MKDKRLDPKVSRQSEATDALQQILKHRSKVRERSDKHATTSDSCRIPQSLPNYDTKNLIFQEPSLNSGVSVALA